jgi:hypothetical protein
VSSEFPTKDCHQGSLCCRFDARTPHSMKEKQMCEYSLEGVPSRPARIGDRLVSTRFKTSFMRGFGLVGARDIAICLVPGTEVVFDRVPEIDAGLAKLPKRAAGDALAHFRRVNDDRPYLPHDALEFADGEIVLLTQLAENQTATVIQIPISAARAAEYGQSELAA